MGALLNAVEDPQPTSGYYLALAFEGSSGLADASRLELPALT
jgi:hypothetical protein